MNSKPPSAPTPNQPAPAPAQPFGRMAPRDAFREMQTLIKTPRPVIIDGGANLGHTSLQFLTLFPDARIFAFEANPEIVDELKRKMAAHPQVTVLPNAIGAENKNIPFNVTNDNGASSIFQPNETVLKYHGEKLHVKT